MLGLYYNYWPHPILFHMIGDSTHKDFPLLKHARVQYKQEVAKCNVTSTNKEYTYCIRNWLRKGFMGAKCSKGWD